MDIANLDMSRKVHLRGINFFIERVELTIRQNKIEPAAIDLIESDIEGIFDGFESADSSAGGGGIGPETGDCYTIEIDTEIYDIENDTLLITRQRPGAEEEERPWSSFFYVQSGFIITIGLCSTIVPTFRVNDTPTDPVLGVTVTVGGSCSSDATCLP